MVQIGPGLRQLSKFLDTKCLKILLNYQPENYPRGKAIYCGPCGCLFCCTRLVSNYMKYVFDMNVFQIIYQNMSVAVDL